MGRSPSPKGRGACVGRVLPWEVPLQHEAWVWYILWVRAAVGKRSKHNRDGRLTVLEMSTVMIKRQRDLFWIRNRRQIDLLADGCYDQGIG